MVLLPLLSKLSSFIALIKKVIPNVVITHFYLHRYALASKTLPADLKKIIMTVVKVVNFIRARALHHRLFRVLSRNES